MTRREQLQEQYEDAFFALLMDDLAVDMGKKAKEENEILMRDPQFAVSKTARRRCLKAIKNCFAYQTAHDFVRFSGKLISKVAVAVLLAILLFTTAFATYEPFRRGILNSIITTFEDHTELRFDTSAVSSCQFIEPGWLPEGYELKSTQHSQFMLNQVYAKSDESEIEVTVSDISGGTENIDTENANICFVDVRGYTAMTMQKDYLDGWGSSFTEYSIVWLDTAHGWVICIESSVEPVDVLLKLANNLVLS